MFPKPPHCLTQNGHLVCMREAGHEGPHFAGPTARIVKRDEQQADPAARLRWQLADEPFALTSAVALLCGACGRQATFLTADAEGKITWCCPQGCNP